MHAANLWRQGRHVEAVRVWGEVILPSAPPKYWTIFVNRLKSADKLELIVKWYGALPSLAPPPPSNQVLQAGVDCEMVRCSFLNGRLHPRMLLNSTFA